MPDLLQLLRNVRRALHLCPTWRDRVRYLHWLYQSPQQDQLERVWEVALAFPHTPTLRLGLRANCASDSYVLGEVFDQRAYEVSLPYTPQTVLDLGANAGFATLFFATRWPGAKLACVEPAPANVTALRRNLDLNGISARVFAGAVAATDGEAVLHCGERAGLHSLLSTAKELTAQTLRVTTWSVPTLLRELGWQQIDWLKMDIEGAEQDVLLRENGWLAQVRALCLEVHGEFGEAQLQSVGAQFGFAVRQLPSGLWLLQRG